MTISTPIPSPTSRITCLALGDLGDAICLEFFWRALLQLRNAGL
jgi:hypothetical protein